jgi:hypothetical protein
VKDLALLVVGWLFGLLSAPITEAINKWRVKAELRAALLTDMKSLGYRMAHVVYMFEERYGTWDRAVLERLLPVLERYQPTDGGTSLDAGVRTLLRADDAKLAVSLAARRQDALGQGMSVKEYRLRILEAHVGELRLFGSVVQRRLLEVAAQLEFYNGHVADAREWLRMTFDRSLSEVDRASVQGNLASTYRNIAERAWFILKEVGAAEVDLTSDA